MTFKLTVTSHNAASEAGAVDWGRMTGVQSSPVDYRSRLILEAISADPRLREALYQSWVLREAEHSTAAPTKSRGSTVSIKNGLAALIEHIEVGLYEGQDDWTDEYLPERAPEAVPQAWLDEVAAYRTREHEGFVLPWNQDEAEAHGS